MKLKLLLLSVMLGTAYQVNCMANKVSFNVGIGTTLLGIGSLAWQIYSKDYSLKKSLITGSLFVTGIGSLLWSSKKKPVLIKPYGKMPILPKQINEIVNEKNYDLLQELICSYGYKEVNKQFNRHETNLFVLLMNDYKNNVISAEFFYSLGLDNLGWDKIINSYGYLNLEQLQEILKQIKTPQEINALSIVESVDYDDDYHEIPLGDVISPLHYAVQSDNMLPLVKLLIQEGANIYACSTNGESVYDHAINYKSLKIANYIKQYAKLQIALGFNCRNIVFSGSKAREFCTNQLKLKYPDIDSMNPHEFEIIGTQFMEMRMKNGQNAQVLPIEIIDHIASDALASSYKK